MKKMLVLTNFFLLILFLGFSVWKEEGNLKRKSFYLKTAPADPRSIIQGDYMLLNYELGEEVRKKLKDSEMDGRKKGYLRVALDEKKVAHFIGLEDKYREGSEGEMTLQFYRNGFMIDFGVNSYFFQEGDGALYQDARYAEVIPLDRGKLRLKSLLDKDFKRIK